MAEEPAWPDLAEALSERLPVSRLELEAWEELLKLQQTQRIILACSGGADSVALVLLLWIHLHALRSRFEVRHFNHGLRGAKSDGDEVFVRELASALGLSVRCGKPTESLVGADEASLREARYHYLESGLDEEDVILLGHHQSDVIEHFLIQVSRGAGLSALASPRAVSILPGHPRRLRPLLRFKGPQLRMYLHELGVPWREDSTNAEGIALRNRMRAEVVPAWKRAAGDEIERHASATRARLQEADEALESLAMRRLPESGQALPRARLLGEPRELIRRVLWQWLAREGAPVPGRAATTRILEYLEEGGAHRVTLGEECYLEIGEQLAIAHALAAPEWSPVRGYLGSCHYFPDGSCLRIERATLEPEVLERIRTGQIDDQREAWLEPGTGKLELEVRRWQAGDRYQPFGLGGTRKLQDCFVDRRIPRNRRLRLPVITHEALGILWVPGLSISASVAVRQGAREALRLTYQAV